MFCNLNVNQNNYLKPIKPVRLIAVLTIKQTITQIAKVQQKQRESIPHL